jgi:hypothetical protein
MYPTWASVHSTSSCVVFAIGTRIIPMFALGTGFSLRAFQPYARSKVYLDQQGARRPELDRLCILSCGAHELL